MKRGYLSEYFQGVGAKRLSAVEADSARSNQHELNGVGWFLDIFGRPVGRVEMPASYVYMTDDDLEPLVEEAFITLYDARAAHETRTEYRFYYPDNEAMKRAKPGDELYIAKKQDGSVLFIVAASDSTIAAQLGWLFSTGLLARQSYSVRTELDEDEDRIELAATFILESIGIVVETTDDSYLEEMLERFNGDLPTTRVFSEFARSTLPEVVPYDDPDWALVTWIEREELLFRTLERYLISSRLEYGFGAPGAIDVEAFIDYSKSVHGRRRSRAGYALENHLRHLFAECGVRHSYNVVTENRSKPDFLFPGIDEYREPAFLAENLTMLGVKSTCKDRWRQVLAEADRIDCKHLLTLESPVSTAQTNEMIDRNLQLVVPGKLQQAYRPHQRDWLMTLGEFIEIAQDRDMLGSSRPGFF